jgi:mRNA interferase MazF
VKRGDIVIVALQGESGKPRLAVVVQSDDLGSDRRTIIICPMSSHVEDSPYLRPAIQPSPENGLRQRSQIMTERITAARRDRVRNILGHLQSHDRERLDKALLIVLGLAR